MTNETSNQVVCANNNHQKKNLKKDVSSKCPISLYPVVFDYDHH